MSPANSVANEPLYQIVDDPSAFTGALPRSESYIKGYFCFWFHVRLGIEWNSEEFCAVVYRAGRLHQANWDALTPCDGRVFGRRNGEIQPTMLVDAIKLVQEHEPKPVHSVVWLHRFDDNLGRWVNCLDLSEPALWGRNAFLGPLVELGSSVEDRKLAALGLYVSERLRVVGRQLKEDVIESRSQVVNAISDQQTQVCGGLGTQSHFEHPITGLRIDFLDNSTSIRFQEPSNLAIELVQMKTCAVKFQKVTR